jgi:UDP-glucose:(heptosyl)LPS alpha-1,3-glucosyltransferase
MRLCCVLFHWFPHGGLQQDVLKIAQACRNHAQVTILCMRWDGPLPEGIEVQVLKPRGWTRTAQRSDFVARVQALRSRFDTVLGFNRMPGLDWYFAADSCFAHKMLYARSWWYRLAPRTRQYLAWERAVFGPDSRSQILLLSPQQEHQYRQCHGTPAARLHMLPPGIRREFMASPAAAQQRLQLRHELGLAEDDLLLLQVGSGLRVKGVERSLQAIAALSPALARRVHYVQIGRGDLAPWWRRAERLGLSQVRFMGARDDVPGFMLAADLLLHPSVQESAGMVILEAMVSGLPVLATASCGYAFHLEQAAAGLVCPEPFRQETLNHLLQQMLQADRHRWREAGLAYGRTQDLYDMPGAVARLLCGVAATAAPAESSAQV